LRDLFLAYLAILKERARLDYWARMIVWASLVPYQKRPDPQPDVPRILKGI
jgi:hypothetical protein